MYTTSVTTADLRQSIISPTLAYVQTLLYSLKTIFDAIRTIMSTGIHFIARSQNNGNVLVEKIPNLNTNGITILIIAIKISASTKMAVLVLFFSFFVFIYLSISTSKNSALTHSMVMGTSMQLPNHIYSMGILLFIQVYHSIFIVLNNLEFFYVVL